MVTSLSRIKIGTILAWDNCLKGFWDRFYLGTTVPKRSRNDFGSGQLSQTNLETILTADNCPKPFLERFRAGTIVPAQSRNDFALGQLSRT